MRYLLPFVFATLVVIAGCAPAPVLVDPDEPPAEAVYPHHTRTQILHSVYAVAEADDLQAISSQARISLRSPAQNADGTAIVRQRAADTLWASVRGPLNIEVARALVTPDSFFVHDRLRNELVVGPAAAAGRLFPGPTGADEIFRAVTGTVVPDPGIAWIVNASTVDGRAVYWLTAPDARQRIAVDPLNWRVRRFERLAADGTVIDRRLYSDFGILEGRMLPRLIELSNPAEATFLTLEHRQLTLNPLTLTFPFSPGGATIIPIG